MTPSQPPGGTLAFLLETGEEPFRVHTGPLTRRRPPTPHRPSVAHPPTHLAYLGHLPLAVSLIPHP